MPLFAQERCSNTADSRIHCPSIIEGEVFYRYMSGQVLIRISGPEGLQISEHGQAIDLTLARWDYGFIELFEGAGPARLLGSYEEVDELLAKFRKPREEWTRPTH